MSCTAKAEPALVIADEHCREGCDSATTKQRVREPCSCSYLSQCDVAQRNDRRRRLLRSIETRVVDQGFWLQAGCAARVISYGKADEGGMLGGSR